MNTSVDSNGSIESPRFASSPNQRSQTPISKRTIRILDIIFQSLRSKREGALGLEYSEPDIVLASETWLIPSIAEREPSGKPESYRFVARRVRLTSSHGGVAIIAKQDLEAFEIDQHSNGEIVAASFKYKDLKKLITDGSLYRPRLLPKLRTVQRPYPLDKSKCTPARLRLDKDAISGYSYPVSINQFFLDNFSDTGCEHIVDFSTMIDNTLDIFGTIRLSVIGWCISLAGHK